MPGKVRIRFKVDVLDNACLVTRAVHLMTHSQFAEGYNLIRDMQGSEFLAALHMLAEHGVLIRKLSNFRERHKARQSEPTVAMLTRAAERGDDEAKSLLAASTLERWV